MIIGTVIIMLLCWAAATGVSEFWQWATGLSQISRESRRNAWSGPGSIRCNGSIEGGWGLVKNFRKIPPKTQGQPTRYIGDLDCIDKDGEVELDVEIAAQWPLDECPELASRESVIATQIEIDNQCDTAKIEARMDDLNIFRLPDATPLLLHGKDILRSIDVAADGRTLLVSSAHAYQHHTGQVGADRNRPFVEKLYLVWVKRSRDGSVLFSLVRDAISFGASAPVPGLLKFHVPHGAPKVVPDMDNARLELRALTRWSTTEDTPWEVSLFKGPFPRESKPRPLPWWEREE